MNKERILAVIHSVLPDHKISDTPQGHLVTSQWSWIKGKPKSYGNFFGIIIDSPSDGYHAKLKLINIPQNYIPLAGITLALTQIGWGDWARMAAVLCVLYSVIGWYFRKEYLFYRGKSIEILDRLNSKVP